MAHVHAVRADDIAYRHMSWPPIRCEVIIQSAQINTDVVPKFMAQCKMQLNYKPAKMDPWVKVDPWLNDLKNATWSQVHAWSLIKIMILWFLCTKKYNAYGSHGSKLNGLKRKREPRPQLIKGTELKITVHMRIRKNMTELKHFCCKEWAKRSCWTVQAWATATESAWFRLLLPKPGSINLKGLQTLFH